ncbi:MAG: sugar phosphate isomerase/epimerase [Firmicutes bacterium]|nr:sugar phosphate isomerase/epimerase [Bacillota bacterium]
MKKGISVWAFAGKDPARNFALAREAGFDGVELALDEDGPVGLGSTKAEMEELRDLAAKSGIELYSLATGLYWKYSFTSGSAETRAKAAEVAKKQLDAASWLKCDAILLIPGMVAGFEPGGEVVPYDAAYDRALEAVSRLAPYAEERGVAIGVENVWNKFLLSPLEMRDFIDKAGSPFVKAYFDVGNALRDGYPEQWIRILGNRIAKVHFKDYSRAVGTLEGFRDLLSGDVDYPEVMKALADTGYDGWVTAEVFPYRRYPEALIFGASMAMDRILGRGRVSYTG